MLFSVTPIFLATGGSCLWLEDGTVTNSVEEMVLQGVRPLKGSEFGLTSLPDVRKLDQHLLSADCQF